MSFVQTQLEIGHICRTSQQWDLYEVQEWLGFRERHYASYEGLGANENGLLMPGMRSLFFDEAHNILNKYESGGTSMSKFYNFYLNALDGYFPGVREILGIYQGKIALCGGFFSAPTQTRDVDIFFYNCTPDEAQEIIEGVCRLLPAIFKGKDLDPNIKLEFMRCQETSNIYYKNRTIFDEQSRKIQFIHRIYPSLAHVIGGFDVQASMIAFDGNRIVANLMGAWAFMNRTVVADISRASTSFMHRLAKYNNRGYSIIFPGYDVSVKNKLVADVKKQEENFRRSLEETIRKQGFRLRRWDHDYGYGGSNGRIFHMSEVEVSDIENVEIMHGFWLRLDYVHRGSIVTKPGAPEIQDYGVPEANVFYGQNEDSIDVTNAVALIKGNTKGFSTQLTELQLYRPPTWSIIKDGFKITQDYEEVVDQFCESINTFITKTLVSLLGGYQNIPVKYRDEAIDKITKIRYDRGYWTQEYDKALYRRTVGKEEFKALFRAKLFSNRREFENRLRSMVWMTQNPQLQWSSTIHPELLTAQEFYKGSWNGFIIFPWSFTRLFFIGQTDSGSSFFRMPRDVIKMILNWVPFVLYSNRKGFSLVKAFPLPRSPVAMAAIPHQVQAVDFPDPPQGAVGVLPRLPWMDN